MEITKITRNSCEVNVIFTGAQYIFHNAFYGILAVAERKEFDIDKAHTGFTLYYGNNNTLGGRFGGKYCLSMAKSFINKSENRYVKTDVTYEEVNEDLDGWYLDFSAKRR